jgi:hypothetical protein
MQKRPQFTSGLLVAETLGNGASHLTRLRLRGCSGHRRVLTRLAGCSGWAVLLMTIASSPLAAGAHGLAVGGAPQPRHGAPDGLWLAATRR